MLRGLTILPHNRASRSTSLRDTLLRVQPEATDRAPPLPSSSSPVHHANQDEASRPAIRTEAASEGVRAMFWNINVARESTRIDRIGALVRSHGFAFVGLCEVPWSSSVARETAAQWGYPHHLMLSSTTRRFNLVLMAKSPLTRVASVDGGSFFHGVLCGALSTTAHAPAHLVVCVTHLTPHAPPARLAEARALRRTVLPSAVAAATAMGGSLPASQPPLILLGDLNALSADDSPAHARAGLAERLAPSRSWRKFAVGGRLDYTILDALTSEGDDTVTRPFGSSTSHARGGSSTSHARGGSRREGIGPLHDLHSPRPTSDDTYDATVPTDRGGDPRHAAPMRLDFALASTELRQRCPAAASYVLTHTTHGTEAPGNLSDHFPIVVSLCKTDAAFHTHETGPDAAFHTRPPPTIINQSSDSAGGCPRASYDRGIRYASYDHVLAAPITAICRTLSTLAPALAAHRARLSTLDPPLAAHRGPRAAPLRRCAVVGSSGQLISGRALGEEIDTYDAVIRLNAAPTIGYESRVGGFTSARFVNAPQSSAWGRILKRQSTDDVVPPKPVSQGELLMVHGSASAWQRVTPRANLSARLLDRDYRKRCVLPFFSDADHAAHTARHANRLTPTFGFEAVAHALHACASVDVYGFGVPTEALRGSEREELAAAEARLNLPPEGAARLDLPPDGAARLNLPPEDAATHDAAARAATFRYHYWEARTHDPSAEHPDQPWTYRSHNFALERARLRHMHCAGVLTLHSPG